MPEADVETATVRRAARVFSARSFRPILAEGASGDLDKVVRRLRGDLGLPGDSSNGDVIDAAYKLIARSYRSEYIYKNLITSKIFIGRHRAASSVLLNEFVIGGAIADTVLMNGCATAYEIKTELDTPDKLGRQLVEYHRAFPLINVVVHESAAERYAHQLRETPAGLIAVGKRWQLSTVKVAESNSGDLCIRSMFNTLRAGEVAEALTRLGIELPQVPNGRRYSEYLKLATEVPASKFHCAWLAVLKNRRLRGDLMLHRNPKLFPLRSLLVQLDPTAAQGTNLLAWLSTRE